MGHYCADSPRKDTPIQTHHEINNALHQKLVDLWQESKDVKMRLSV